MPRMVIEEAECSSLVVEVEQPIITIGRVHGNDIVFNHSAVSKRHAVLQIHGSYSTITDLNSRNGIYVNEVKISHSVTVRQDDLIRIVDYKISFPSMNSISTDPHPSVPSQNHYPAGVFSGIAQIVRREFVPQRPRETRETTTHVKLPSPTTASLRSLIMAIFTTDSDFDAFCLDYFPKIKSKFSNAMDRTAKANLLLESVPADAIYSNLSNHWSEAVAQHQQLIRFECENVR